eukprot:7660711-Alexandrium_andersonii.AAC.1
MLVAAGCPRGCVEGSDAPERGFAPRTDAATAGASLPYYCQAPLNEEFVGHSRRSGRAALGALLPDARTVQTLAEALVVESV